MQPTERPLSYEQIWDELRAGRLSTTVLAHLMRVDEVFREWCIRKRRDHVKSHNTAAPRISDEDMA